MHLKKDEAKLYAVFSWTSLHFLSSYWVGWYILVYFIPIKSSSIFYVSKFPIDYSKQHVVKSIFMASLIENVRPLQKNQRSQRKAQPPCFLPVVPLGKCINKSIDYLAGLKKRHAIIYRKSFSLFFNDCSDEESRGRIKGSSEASKWIVKAFFQMEPPRAAGIWFYHHHPSSWRVNLG